MKLDAVQSRIIRSKPSSFSLLKGVNGTGKTITAVHRTFYLKNNFCIYDEDRILILAKDSINRDSIRQMYNKIEDETKIEYRTLFTNNMDKVDIYTLGDIINRYYFEYTNSSKKCFKIIQEEKEILTLLQECSQKLRDKYKGTKILRNDYLEFFKDEVLWIKACGYRDLESYQQADRIGRRYKKGKGPSRLLKNSKERQFIFELFESYNKKLQKNSLLDYQDINSIALYQTGKSKNSKYTHIIVDEAQELTKTEIDFISSLRLERSYGSITFIINKSIEPIYSSWFIKGRRLNNLGLGTVKSHLLSKVYITEGEGEKQMNNAQSSFNSMESFKFIDIKNHRSYDFKRDSSIIDEIILEEGNNEESIKAESLKAFPVYSDIAAGEPIMMNNELEAEFYLPEYFIRGAKDCFILRVKGDSMIGANIFDGDHVVIRRQHIAQKGDIVAVDLEGNATLKRLAYNKNIPVLMPENDNYSPIFIHDREASVLGVAVGIIKSIQ
ncbi:UvrD-helicase domain-containing protein [Clostridium sp. YIM B02515]|uniref:UvrD-helicase domain-containing protein n=1 Tax=Clostridium rhizosphaerae TaxID=2803861 RepID=A0ABS1T9S9_9CLOT|nr:S24 family peptidase [Clostridium rhizosphaerae]MBL4935421.1 UvrD-helicase domain-containing protein [Clostridium rhizosphaerae]